MWIRISLTDPRLVEKSSDKRLKHKVVKLILIYFIINNAFYKNELNMTANVHPH